MTCGRPAPGFRALETARHRPRCRSRLKASITARTIWAQPSNRSSRRPSPITNSDFDDGSTDASRAIAESYARTDPASA